MSDWIAAVARRAGVDPSVVPPILASCGIEPGGTLGIPREMTLTRVAFDGEKRIHTVAAPFAFEWELGLGVNCIASDQNLVGKTSVLEVVRWAIRGRSDLRGDVQAWIRRVELDLEIGRVPYRVEFDLRLGHPVGAIRRTDTGTELASFTTHEGFEAAADGFFIDALGLVPIQGWQSERGGDGRQTVHGWAAISEVLRVTDGSYLLASDAFGGINGRLLDLYTGLSWATTYQAALVAIQEEARRAGVESRRRQAVVDLQSQRGDALTAELAQRRGELSALPDERAWTIRAAEVQHVAAEAETNLAALRRELLASDAAVRDARDARLVDGRSLQQLEEAAVAGRFFGALDPHMCPRCDASIGDDRRRRETSAHRCAVCGEPVGAQAPRDFEIVDARRRLAASTAAEAAAASRRGEAALELEHAERAAVGARQELATLARPPELVVARRALELDIARLEGRIAAGTEATNEMAMPDTDAAARRTILVAAREEANARRQAEEHEMFPQINDRILELVRTFGIRNAEAVRLDGAGRLNLQTGGHPSPLSALTPGERVRAKLAVVLALLQVGRERGVGRHPGLVLIDSPGSHEVSDADLGSMLSELQQVASVTPGTQVLVTTRQLQLARSIVPPERLRGPQADGSVW